MHSPTRRRCRPLRVERSDVLWFVSSRTVEARFWFLPLVVATLKHRNRAVRRTLERYERGHDKRLKKVLERAHQRCGPYQPRVPFELAKELLRDLAGAALARAQERYGVELLAVVLMSNHVHLLLCTPQRNLRLFMGYFKARLADGTNWLLGRSGPLWARRYDAEPVLDDEAAQGRLAYTLCNPVKAGLVERANRWPGLTAAYGWNGTERLEFRYLDRTAWHRAGRPQEFDACVRTASLELSPLPEWASRTPSEAKGVVQRMVAEQEREARRERNASEAGVLGLEGLGKSAFDQRPKAPKRTRRPYVHVTCPDKRRAHQEAMNALLEAYGASAEKWRCGNLQVAFPEGTYRPTLVDPVACAA